MNIINAIKKLLTPQDWALEILKASEWAESDFYDFLDLYLGDWVEEVPEPEGLTREHVFLILDSAIGFEEIAAGGSEEEENIRAHEDNRRKLLAIQKRFVDSAPEECIKIAKTWCVHRVLDESWDSALGADFTHSRKVLRGEVQEAVC